jgi:H+/Cl- antiporter ClcA
MEGVNSQDRPTATILVRLSVPAILVGVLSGLGLILVEGTAHLLQRVLWVEFPGLFNLDPDSGWWIFGVLSVVGLAVGVVCTFVPGRGGPDSATVELLTPPLPLSAVPGLLLVSLLVLAGGVSLGPESPIIAINIAILVALIGRVWPNIDVKLVMLMTAAGTIGALFGTPVAAALVLTGVLAAADTGGALWDKLFLPLVAAGTGSLTIRMLDGPQFGPTDIPPLGVPHPSDFLIGAVVACAAALVILVGAFAFRSLHASFRRLRSPLLYTTLGGVILGGLGALGGPVTLFAGGQQMADLIRDAEDQTTAQLLLIIAVKLAALLVAATAGFRGGRIFPAIFIGAAVGLVAQSLMPQIPLGLALACGVLGAVLAECRDGWLALFIAVVVVADISVLALLCVVILPVWLLVTGAPKMLVRTADNQGFA